MVPFLFSVILSFAQYIIMAADVLKNSTWSISPEYLSRVETPALFYVTRRSLLACANHCATVSGCDVITFTSGHCVGYISFQATPTAPLATSYSELYNPLLPIQDPSGVLSTTNAIVMKRVCAGWNYIFLAELNWCVRLVNVRDQWNEAESLCNESGGRLAVLNTSDKFAAISSNFDSNEKIWVGGTLTNKLWYFTTGQALEATRFTVVSDSQDEGQCLSYFDKAFYSGNCQSFRNFLCEEVW